MTGEICDYLLVFCGEIVVELLLCYKLLKSTTTRKQECTGVSVELLLLRDAANSEFQ